MEELIQWEFSYNAWQLCLLEITGAQTTSARVAAVLNLISEIINTDPASASQFVHANTFRYRLRRVQEVSGLDLDDPDARFAAMLQLRMLG